MDCSEWQRQFDEKMCSLQRQLNFLSDSLMQTKTLAINNAGKIININMRLENNDKVPEISMPLRIERYELTIESLRSEILYLQSTNKKLLKMLAMNEKE